MIRSPADKEKEKLQVQLDNIKKIILSNPYKYSNYVEHNSALVPEKLINRNIFDGSPVFDEEDEDEDNHFTKQMKSHHPTLQATAVQYKQMKAKTKQKSSMIMQYQLSKTQEPPNGHHLPAELKIPGIKDKLSLIHEEHRMFGGSTIPYPAEFSPIKANYDSGNETPKEGQKTNF